MLGIVVAFVAALLDLAAAALGWDHLRPFTKPLPALILAATALGSRTRPGRVLGSGLLLAAIGDEVLLNASEGAFLGGMLAFAAMQLAYIVAFRSSGTPAHRDAFTWVAGGVYLVSLIGANALLDPHAGQFAIPLAVYSVLLAAMAWSAFDLRNRVRHGAIAAAIGGALFMCSDTTLACAKFYPGFPLGGRTAELAILATYFTAQLLIVAGMMRANAISS